MALNYLSDEELSRLPGQLNTAWPVIGGHDGLQGQSVVSKNGQSYTDGHGQVKPVSPQHPHHMTPRLTARSHHYQAPHLTPITRPSSPARRRV